MKIFSSSLTGKNYLKISLSEARFHTIYTIKAGLIIFKALLTFVVDIFFFHLMELNYI